MPTCAKCQQSFEVLVNDQQFYEKMQVPAPTLCPLCRRQRRLSFRNERNLYNRKCNLTGKSIVSVYSAQVPFAVYDHEVWHSDQWEALNYGRDFDFSRPFFDQFEELYRLVPRLNFMNQASENSDYTNYAYRNKNCYLVFGSHYNEDCLYANYIWKGVNCMDCLEVIQSELVYEGIYSDSCYSCAFIEYCFDCNDCAFCYDLIGCKNCLFSSNLRNKQYYIFNKPNTKEEYQAFLEKLNLTSYQKLQEAYRQYKEVRAQAIKRAMFQKNCENCLGTDIQNAKNVYLGFNSKYLEDCNYVDTQATHVKDALDLTCIGYDQSELLYECVGNSGNTQVMFCNACWHNYNTTYCEQCFDSKDLFGCIGLKHKQYCILNKQYSKEEYEALLPRIIEYMRQTKEWGEFFPAKLSVFAYNESMAQLHFPLKEAEAKQNGYKWKPKEAREYQKQQFVMPDLLSEVTDSVTNELLACETCGKNYKIIPAELKFYRRQKIALPHQCPDCRHQARVALKTPRVLWERKCSKCSVPIKTSFAPESKDQVYCEQCYNKEVY